MSKPLISLAVFDQLFEDGKLEELTREDLERMDYDPPKERVALVSWRAERVGELGELEPAHWHIEMAGDVKRWRELHTWGVLFFGDPPWRRSQVLTVFGRLGSIEAAVKALASPAPEFRYDFVVDEAVKPTGLAAEARRLPELKGRFVPNEDKRQRARWRRASVRGGEDEARAKAKPRQGELF